MRLWQDGQLVPEEAMDYVPQRCETAVPEWKAECEPFAQHDSITAATWSGSVALSASRPLFLQNEAATPRYPRAAKEHSTGKSSTDQP